MSTTDLSPAQARQRLRAYREALDHLQRLQRQLLAPLPVRGPVTLLVRVLGAPWRATRRRMLAWPLQMAENTVRAAARDLIAA